MNKKTISYYELSEIIGSMVLNNYIMNATEGIGYWEIINGNDYNDEDGYFIDVYQTYIIDAAGAEYLQDHTDEIVYYNEELGLYLWGITHFGTPWTGVYTEIWE